MGYGTHLLRRASGVYVFRLVVPVAHRPWFDSREIHRSTQARTRPDGDSQAKRWRASWDRIMSEQATIDALAGRGSMLLGTGVAQLGDIAQVLGLPVGDLALELANAQVSLWAHADSWSAVQFDGPVCSLWREDGEIPFSEVDAVGEPCHLRGLVQLSDAMSIALKLKRGASFVEPYLVMHPQLGTCFVARPGPPRVPPEHLLVRKPEVTAWRERLLVEAPRTAALWTGITSAQRPRALMSVAPVQVVEKTMPQAPSQPMGTGTVDGPHIPLAEHVDAVTTEPVAELEPLPAGKTTGPAALDSDAPLLVAGGRFGSMRMSELAELYVGAMTKAKPGQLPRWKGSEEAQRNGAKFKVFWELAGNPTMAALGTMPEAEQLVERFLDEAQALPAGQALIKARAALPEGTAQDHIRWADAKGETERMSLRTVRNSYLAKVSECLGWGMSKGYVAANPCAVVLKQVRLDPQVHASAPRKPFTDEELQQIFSAPWFREGEPGCRGAGMQSAHFRPYQYWLPLLGLYAGGRINELSQLYLDDLKTTEDGIPYIAFTLDRPDKRGDDDAEDDQLPQRAGARASLDKSLKTVNAQREVPIHQVLVDLGLLRYAEALRAAGHERLFPELRFDRIKGYGATPRKWFNDQYLGKTLKIPRNGTKVFHSLRHNFTVAARHARIDLRSRQQLLGHKRGGDSTTEQVYDHDDDLHLLQQGVAQVSYALPEISLFDIAAGLRAVKYTQRRVRSGTDASKKVLAEDDGLGDRRGDEPGGGTA